MSMSTWPNCVVYRYHTGVMFAAYTPRAGTRYRLGWPLRQHRPGVSGANTARRVSVPTSRCWPRWAKTTPVELGRIFAPAGTEPELLAAIRDYRAAGYVVVQALAGQAGDAAGMGCAQRMSNASGSWQLEDVDDATGASE